LDDFKKIKVVHGPSIALLVDNPTDLKFVDKGAHGAVFKLSEKKCVKIYADNHNAEKEAKTYQMGQGSEIVPKLYEVGDNYIIIEFIEGISLWKYLSKKKEISFEITKKIILLLKEMKRLGFTRIDSSLRHIMITQDERLKAIDLVYAYVRTDVKPVKVFSELQRLGLVKQFLEHVEKIDKELFIEWKEVMAEYIN
jgi:predicted Ser/Thr protein kinase